MGLYSGVGVIFGMLIGYTFGEGGGGGGVYSE